MARLRTTVAALLTSASVLAATLGVATAPAASAAAADCDFANPTGRVNTTWNYDSYNSVSLEATSPCVIDDTAGFWPS